MPHATHYCAQACPCQAIMRPADKSVRALHNRHSMPVMVFSPQTSTVCIMEAQQRNGKQRTCVQGTAHSTCSTNRRIQYCLITNNIMPP